MADKGTSPLFLCLDPALHGSEVCCKAVRSRQCMASASLGQLRALEGHHNSPQKTTAAGKAFRKSFSEFFFREHVSKREIPEGGGKKKKDQMDFLKNLGEAFQLFQPPFCPT